jgi:sarcosine dehydrogenase
VANALPSTADVVVIGAGAIGCAIAWQLTEHGISDVVVLEKSGITHGSTWHAAGLIGQYRSREDLTRVMQASVEIYDAVSAETPIDWRAVGSLRLASSAARWREYQKAAPIARRYGVGFHLLDAAEARRRFPEMSTEGVHGAAFVDRDGYVDPSSLTQAYAARARKGGARIVETAAVTAIDHRAARGGAIETDKGSVTYRTLVIAAGVWARAVGQMLGVALPVACLEHQYAVTQKRPGLPRDLPALRDPDLNFYLKPEVGGYAVGGWESGTPAVYDSAMPMSFGRELLPENLDRLQPILEAATRRIPALATIGLKTIINGPIPVTPDGEPILGPAPGLENVFLAVGFTSGIAASGGAGRLLAGWIKNGKPEFPLPSLDPRRFGALDMPVAVLNRQARAAYAGYYALSEAASQTTPRPS